MRAASAFRDGTFHNTSGLGPGLQQDAIWSTLGEYFTGGQVRSPPAPLPAMNPLDALSRPVQSGLRATWLGHSTTLLEVDGVRLLTDPVWGERASPWRLAGPKRFQPVPISVANLPPLDAVLISHDHYDHLDYPTILALAELDVPFITALGVGAHLEGWGVPPERIVELDWWEEHRVAGSEVRVTATPCQHFSGRGPTDRNRTLWASLAVRGPRSSVFFSGDTGLTEEYAEVRQRLGAFDLVMLEIGAWHPSWGSIHLGPSRALDAHALLGGGAMMPVHWGTFNLAMHAWDEPAETLLTEGAARGVQLVMPRLGQSFEPAHAEAVEPWWREVGARAAGRVAFEPAAGKV